MTLNNEHKKKVERLLSKFPEKLVDKFSIKFAQDSCVICFDEFKENTMLREIPDCSHIFHGSCLQTWWEQQPRGNDIACPLCNCTVVGEYPSVRDTEMLHTGMEETKRTLFVFR